MVGEFKYVGQNGFAFDGISQNEPIGVLECAFNNSAGEALYTFSTPLLFHNQASNKSVPLFIGDVLAIKAQIKIPEEQMGLLRSGYNHCVLAGTAASAPPLHYGLKREAKTLILTPLFVISHELAA